MAIELYGHYISKGLCPQMNTKSKQTTCTGNGNCGSDTKQCVADKGNLNNGSTFEKESQS